MFKKFLPLLLILIATCKIAYSQEYIVDIEDKQEANRLYIYALNKNLVDLDVFIEFEGSGFRARGGRQLLYRVPARSKVNIATLIVERGWQAMYTYKLHVSDSLSRRVRKMPFELIKIDPKKPISVFIPKSCVSKCDTIVAKLDESPFNYRKVVIDEDERVKQQLSGALVGGMERIDTMDNPIVSIGGKMYVSLETYDELMAKLEEEDEPVKEED